MSGMPDLRKAVISSVDTGGYRAYVVESTLRDTPGVSEIEVETMIDTLIGDGTLTWGKTYGGEDYMVVTAWMPNAAATLRRKK